MRRLCKEASDTVLRWSFWIWLGKEKEEWFAQREGKRVEVPVARISRPVESTVGAVVREPVSKDISIGYGR